jgi:hypothetical protein
MQASKIVLGETYAYPHDGEERAFIITTHTTVKSTNNKTSNTVGGFYTDDNGNRVTLANLDVADIIGEWTRHEELKAKEAKLRAEKQAVLDALKERQLLAVDLLAKAIGAQAVHERYKPYGQKDWMPWDDKKGAVIAHYGEIIINPQAIESVIAAFNK